MSQLVVRFNMSNLVRRMSVYARPKWLMAIFVAAVSVWGIYGIDSQNSPAGFVDAQNQGICDRTPAVRDEILESLPSGTLCEDVTETDLNGITDFLSLFDPSLDSLHPDDFKGLTAIRGLTIVDTALESLPAGIFSDLQSVTRLSLARNRLTTLARNRLTTVEARAFEGLTAMTQLDLSSNPRLESISPDAFEGLSALQTLNLYQTRISTLPSGVFDGLSSLATLQISVT